MQQIGSWLVVEVTGELDLATAPGLLTQVGRLIALTTSPCIALEMSQITFRDSSGINAVVRLEAHQRLRRADHGAVPASPGGRAAGQERRGRLGTGGRLVARDAEAGSARVRRRAG
ncbi:STAS domain-containing protein [Actinomadura sp. NPDC048394]|uniref:STAS domain-containing protein n=1 Tax=Actinomadura sp. NPDC048394 TaxID=3158223 RepID=UPI0033F68FAD